MEEIRARINLSSWEMFPCTTWLYALLYLPRLCLANCICMFLPVYLYCQVERYRAHTAQVLLILLNLV